MAIHFDISEYREAPPRFGGILENFFILYRHAKVREFFYSGAWKIGCRGLRLLLRTD